KAPPAQGPLVVEAELTGLRFAGRTSSGIHYADAAGTPRLRVGEAVAVDAAGRSATLAAAVDQGRLEFLVPAAFLAGAQYPVAIDPVISPEFGMDTPVRLATYEGQDSPSVAWDGTCWLVAWRDFRMEDPPFVFGARVGANGVILDPGGLQISPVGDFLERPSVAGRAGEFLVTWVDSRGGAANVVAARVGDDGTLPDGAGIPLSPQPQAQVHPSAAGFAGGFLVVWADSRNDLGDGNTDVYGIVVRSDGVPSGDEFPVSLAPGAQSGPSVAAVGGTALVVWSDLRSGSSPGQQDIYGARVVDSSGGVGLPDSAGILLSRSSADPKAGGAPGLQLNPSVAASSDRFLVAWEDRGKDAEGDISATLVSLEGVVLQPGGIPVCALPALQSGPAVGSDGARFFVVWEDRRGGGQDLYGARIDASGGVLDPGGIPVSLAQINQSRPSVAYGGGSYLVAWDDNRSGLFTDIYAARVTPEGGLLDAAGLLVSSAENQQQLPMLGWNGSVYLAAWRDFRREGGFDIQATRLTTAGSVIDPWGIHVSTRGSFNSYPAIGASGDDFLLAWEYQAPGDDHNVWGRRVSGAGRVLDADDLPIAVTDGEQFRTAVQGGGETGWLVAWGDDRADEDFDLYAAVVDRAGRIVTPQNGFVLSGNPELQFSVRLAWNGSNYLAVWRDSRNNPSDSYDYANRICDIYGRLISPAGELLGTEDIPICILPGVTKRYPTVATDGTDFLVAWEDNRGSDYNIYGTLVRSDGAVVRPAGMVLCEAGGRQLAPTASFDGTNYRVVWQDARSGATQIYGREISTAGVPLDPADGFLIDGEARNPLLPWVASSGAGRSLLLFQSPSSPSHVGRVFGRTIASDSHLPPLFDSQPSLVAKVGDVYSYAAHASDPESIPLAVSALQLPGWLALTSGSGGTAVLSGRPRPEDLGVNRVVLLAGDAYWTTAQAFEVVVTGDAPPVFTSIDPAGTGIRVCWAASAGRSYRLEASEALGGAPWVEVATVVADGASACHLDSAPAGAARFYRVIQVP
ncbi:MAG TPA: hypothetical protein DCM86_10495, partial [Verrucomicrobiales bacterium]|nr:hypothetical protein [Verrucomicrobiales bacterium]